MLLPAKNALTHSNAQHMVVDLQRVIEGFTSAVHRKGGSDAFFNDIGAASYVVKIGVYEAQTILGDGFMVSRALRSVIAF